MCVWHSNLITFYMKLPPQIEERIGIGQMTDSVNIYARLILGLW